MLTYKLTGFNEFDKLLSQLPKNVENRVLQSAVTGALRDARKEVRAAAPVGIDHQSPASKKYGRLRKNIRVIRLKRVRRGEKAARIDTGNAFWGLFYEKGTRHQPARPWFLPAFRRASDGIILNLARRLGDGIIKEVKRVK